MQINTDSNVKYTEYGCEFIPNIEFGELTPEQKEQATRMIDSYFTPLPDVEIVKLIARLQIISPEREKHSIDREARTAIWVDELRQYPADIVTKVLKKRYRWFPTLAEVLTDCDFEVEYRNLIRQKLRS